MSADFFISYTGVDRAWAEWIAWQLEEAGYTTILQAWDFPPGCNFLSEMNRATRDAKRMIIAKIRGARRIRILNTWLPNLDTLLPYLEDELRGGCDIEVILLDPASPAGFFRAQTLEIPQDALRSLICHSIGAFQDLGRRHNFTHTLCVRQYPSLPSTAIYQADDYLLAGLFLRHVLAVDGPWLQVATTTDSPMPRLLASEFDRIFDASPPIDLPAWRPPSPNC